MKRRKERKEERDEAIDGLEIAHTTVRYGDSHEQKCRYFLSLFPCQVMSWDAWKPNIKSQTKCTQYTEFQKTAGLLKEVRYAWS